MRSLRSGILAVALAVGMAGAGAFAAEAEGFFESTLGDFQFELEAARAAGKLGVLLAFETEDCHYCRKMRQQILSRDEVQAYFRKRYAIFAVDAFGGIQIKDFTGRDTTEKAYAAALKVRGMPTFILFGTDGREVARLSGLARDAEEFMRFGRSLDRAQGLVSTALQSLAAGSRQ